MKSDDFQDIILKLKSGEGTVDLPNPELFDCIICGVSVKYKREHLNKKHQLDEDVYEELIAKRARGEDIRGDLPEREVMASYVLRPLSCILYPKTTLQVYTCNICERECMDFKRHLQVCHKLTEDQYRSFGTPSHSSFLYIQSPFKPVFFFIPFPFPLPFTYLLLYPQHFTFSLPL